ncbi:conserved hypothetical protein [Rippkaea orientalis PCC 8801]|uniref:Uncharacterized protein n=1 Tax=Rippkaea orientalis (strain PCC 8801 / RF-1) TaxID=41431 RepID=B7K654_RIPO1|nr:hypothetical protein [Rippkaea orientalis]ACK68107.1 conserved hypothetical protein [Rippkaea orientalis PCC 8801]
MFGRQAKEPQSSETPDIPEMMFPAQIELENRSEKNKDINQISEIEQPEVVKIVEKISGIVSPYFIVIVGLSLYEDNVFLGLVLITIGILSLLKISWSSIFELFLGIKSFFSSSDDL